MRAEAVHLTPREFALLQFLAFHRGTVVTRTMIWEHLYDEYDENTSNVVDVYIRYLRTKIDKGFDTPLILTRWVKDTCSRRTGVTMKSIRLRLIVYFVVLLTGAWERCRGSPTARRRTRCTSARASRRR